MQRLETRVPPPVLVLLIAGVMAAWRLAGPGAATAVAADPTWHGVQVGVAVLVLLAGLALVVPAARLFRRTGTTINPVNVNAASKLVTKGPFGFTRNPMYLGMVLILSGIAVWLGGWAVWLGPVAFVAWITRLQIIPEERAMAAKFGADYADYRARVRRWI
jgi:protein-S-isoprenylcysteine O-methyltransferase Ste14